MIKRNEKGVFVKGTTPPNHRAQCGCSRCTKTSPMAGKKNPNARNNPQVFKKGQTAWNKDIPQSKEAKEKNRLAHLGKSSPRKGKKYPEFSGENHPNWKGTTPLYKLIRNSAEYKWWRISVFERDNYTCVECGVRNGNGKSIRLEADHFPYSFALYPEHRFDINNGRTLCVDCHRKTPTYGGGAKSVVTSELDGWICYALISV